MAILSIMGSIALNQATLRSRLELLTQQVSTGYRGAVYGDLGTEARRAIDLRGEIARRETYVAATKAALGAMEATHQVLARLETLVSNVAAEVLRAKALGEIDAEELANKARVALEEAANLLNTQHAGEYLFAGTDMRGAPVPHAADILNGPMAVAIAAVVTGLTPTNAASVLADTAAIVTAPATSPFSAFLEGAGLGEPRRAVQVADGTRVSWGLMANQDYTGEAVLSWGREMLRAFAAAAALTESSAAQGDGYTDLLQGLHDSLVAAGRGLAAERGVLGEAQLRVTAAQEQHGDLLVLIRSQLADAQGVDVAAVSMALRQLETQLAASYQTTAMLSGLSLAAFLR